MRCGAVEDTRRWSWILKTSLTAGSASAFRWLNARHYPPFNDNSDLRIVLPEALRVEWRDPSIEHPTGYGLQQSFNRITREYRAFRSAKILSLDGTVYVRDSVEQEGTWARIVRSKRYAKLTCTKWSRIDFKITMLILSLGLSILQGLSCCTTCARRCSSLKLSVNALFKV